MFDPHPWPANKQTGFFNPLAMSKVYETEEDVANAVAMMDGTELNGNRQLGLRKR